MAKKERTSILRVILVLAVIVCGVVAALAMLGHGLSVSEKTELLGIETGSYVNGYGLIFGGGPLVSYVDEAIIELEYEGGVSYLGLISFICLVLGIIGAVLSLFSKNRGLRLGVAVLFAVAAILMIFLPNVISEITIGGIVTTEVDFTGLNLGAGAISYITFAAIGAIVAVVSCIFRK